MPLFTRTRTATPNLPELNFRIASLAKRHGEVMQQVVAAVAPGVSTGHLADVARAAAQDAGLTFSFRSQFDFPDDISVSRNDKIMGELPNAETLIAEDSLVKIAFGSADMGTAFCMQNWTVAVVAGEPPRAKAKTHAGTKACLDAVIPLCVPGVRVSAIVDALHAEAGRQGIVHSRAFSGHLIGAEPIVLPVLKTPAGLFAEDHVLPEGCMLSLLALGHADTPREDMRDDGWTVYDKNRHPCAAFSHMVLIDANGPKVLTPEYALTV